jgi:hypothetical protein
VIQRGNKVKDRLSILTIGFADRGAC